MKLSRNIASCLLLLGTLASPAAMAEKFCADTYEGKPFQVALVDWEHNGMCVYSAEAMYPLGHGLAPVLKFRSRWKEGHGDWYCRPTTKDPMACQFKLA